MGVSEIQSAAIEKLLARSAKRLERQIAKAQKLADRDDIQILLDQFRPHYSKPSELLLPRKIYDAMPRIGATDGEPAALAQVKFFGGSWTWTWWATECAPVRDEAGKLEDIEFFGLVKGFALEYGYFTLKEIGSVRGQFGLPIERDLSFAPIPIRGIAESLGW